MDKRPRRRGTCSLRSVCGGDKKLLRNASFNLKVKAKRYGLKRYGGNRGIPNSNPQGYASQSVFPLQIPISLSFRAARNLLFCRKRSRLPLGDSVTSVVKILRTQGFSGLQLCQQLLRPNQRLRPGESARETTVVALRFSDIPFTSEAYDSNAKAFHPSHLYFFRRDPDGGPVYRHSATPSRGRHRPLSAAGHSRRP